MCLNCLNPPINWVPRCALRFPETSLKPSIESSNQLGDPDQNPKWGWWKTCRNCPLIGGIRGIWVSPVSIRNCSRPPTPGRACHGSSRCARGHCHLDLGRHRTNCGPPGWLSLDRRNWGPPNIRGSTVVPKKTYQNKYEFTTHTVPTWTSGFFWVFAGKGFLVDASATWGSCYSNHQNLR
jgi:hypothetical protein